MQTSSYSPPSTRSTEDEAEAGRALKITVAAASLGAGAIHFAFAPDHFAISASHGMFFVVVAWLQVAVALAVGLGQRRQRGVLAPAALLNAGVIGVWVVSRTLGISGSVEPVGFPDSLSSVLEGVVVLGCVTLAVGSLPRMRAGALFSGAWIGASAMAVVALVTASLVPALGGGHHHDAAGGHDHAASGTVSAAGAVSPTAGHDAAAHDATAHDATGHSAAPSGGGSQASSSGSTTFAVERKKALVGPLSDAAALKLSEEHRRWLADKIHSNSTLLKSLPADEAERRIDVFTKWQTAHALDAEHGGGTQGNHTHGPTVWQPLTDPAQQALLQQQLETSASLIPRFPTAADAMKAGFFQVTPWVPGIAAHYVNAGNLGSFDPAKPAFLLYNGNGPDAKLVGMSYAVYGPQAPEGFAGPNDLWHNHPSLCSIGVFVVGSDTTPNDLCDSVGGHKGDPNSPLKLWMMHVWQVPGWESYWGLFSGENPNISLASAEPNPVA